MGKVSKSTAAKAGRAKDLPKADPSFDYLQVTLTASASGHLEYSVTTRWVGFESERPLIEQRVPRVVDPEFFIEHWNSLNVSYMVVSTERDLYKYLLVGGHALIEKQLAERHLSFCKRTFLRRPQGIAGFCSAEELPKEARHRAPTPRMRMRILKRDNWRCTICGRRAMDHVDVELHVHHVRPWENGGATIDDNLVTLCHTCHHGLDPHSEPMLFDATGANSNLPELSKEVAEHVAGVKRYRAIAIRQYMKDRSAHDELASTASTQRAATKKNRRTQTRRD